MKPGVPQLTNVKSCFNDIADKCVALHKTVKSSEKQLDELKKIARDVARATRGNDTTVDGVEIRGIQPNIRVLVSFVCPRVSFNEGTSFVDMKRAQVLLGNDVVKATERIALRSNISIATARETIGSEVFDRLFSVETDVSFNGAAYETWVRQNEAERVRMAGNQTAAQALDFVRSVTTTKEETPRVTI